jgi:hypothetical protein
LDKSGLGWFGPFSGAGTDATAFRVERIYDVTQRSRNPVASTLDWLIPSLQDEKMDPV